MEPIPETREAMNELLRHGQGDVAVALWEMTRNVCELVPECVGLSLGIVDGGIVFTMVATDRDLARLDSIQYLDSGPCVEAIETGELTSYEATDPMHEPRWGMFARAAAASGVRSTLSIPILQGDTVVAGVNLYAATAEAFAGRHEEVAAAVGGWAPGAVENADLGFTTRAEAQQAPDRIRAQNMVDIAIGVLAAALSIGTSVAKQRLQAAASRAGIEPVEVARLVIDIHAANT